MNITVKVVIKQTGYCWDKWVTVMTPSGSHNVLFYQHAHEKIKEISRAEYTGKTSSIPKSDYVYMLRTATAIMHAAEEKEMRKIEFDYYQPNLFEGGE